MLLLASVIFILLDAAIALQRRTHGEHRLLTLHSQQSLVELPTLPIREVLGSVCGSTSKISEDLRFANVQVDPREPSVNKYIIGNPAAFLQHPKIAKFYGVDLGLLSQQSSAEELAALLPVIYIADTHPEYGTLGLQLNSKSDEVVGDVYPGLRCMRQRPIYNGGFQQKGSSFMMVHKKVGFTGNRSWKFTPGNTDFRLFFSPDVAMANELCMTNDATPSEFKFFKWATIWPPKQLDMEYEKRKLWITVQGPAKIIFEDDDPLQCPLWRRIVASLPEEMRVEH